MFVENVELLCQTLSQKKAPTILLTIVSTHLTGRSHYARICAYSRADTLASTVIKLTENNDNVHG